MGKMGLGLLGMGCCVWFLLKMQGFWFSVYGLPGEEVDLQGRKRG